MESLNHVFLSYTDGYPLRFCAANTKLDMLGRGLVEFGDEVHTINKAYGPNNVAPRTGLQNGIVYHSVICNVSKILACILSTYNIAKLLKRLFIVEKKNVLYVGCGNVFVFIPLLLWSKIIGYKTALIFEEWEPGVNYTGLYKINAYIHGYYFGYLFDSILPISEFLTSKAEIFGKPICKLPICADFSYPLYDKHNNSEKYFLYCAGIGYKDALDFVLDSFSLAFANTADIHLHLVLSGSQDEIMDYKEKIEKSHKNKISILTHLPYSCLMNEYANARGLLIPLFDDRVSDVARFSQKISEYLTSKSPILSTKVGEVSFYFKNGENMYISESGNINSYANLMKRVIANPDEAKEIGEKGYEYGKKLFDYHVLSNQLHSFMDMN